MPDPTPAPGWYPAPHANNEQRYWDGTQWIEGATAPVADPTPQTTRKKLNILALIAAIVAVVGFIFACMPGALIAGWVLLPIAFILSIVSLFLEGGKKWLGILGLVVSVVGTVAGFVVFFAVMGAAFDRSFGSGETTVTQPDESSEAISKDEEAGKPAAEKGTRQNPYPLESEITSNDWTIVINSVNPDGNAAVAEANEFNKAAPAGSHYEILNYTITHKGTRSGRVPEVDVTIVTSSGNMISAYDNLVILTDSFRLVDELYEGGSVTGSQAFLVPDGETYAIRVRPGIMANEIFVQP